MRPSPSYYSSDVPPSQIGLQQNLQGSGYSDPWPPMHPPPSPYSSGGHQVEARPKVNENIAQKRIRQVDTGDDATEDKRQRKLPDSQLRDVASSSTSIQSLDNDNDSFIAAGLDMPSIFARSASGFFGPVQDMNHQAGEQNLATIFSNMALPVPLDSTSKALSHPLVLLTHTSVVHAQKVSKLMVF